MTARNPRPLWLALPALLALAACGTSSGVGGGSTTPCALDGSCPAGMVCLDGTHCVVPVVDGAGNGKGADAGGAKADAGTPDAKSDAGGGAKGDADTPDAGAKADGGAQVDAGGETDAGAKGDAGGGAAVQKIAALQGGTASKQCPDPKKAVTVDKDVILEDAVATQDAAKLGSSHGVLYVRPLASPPSDGQYGGIKVVVFNKVPEVKAGDVVRVRGDLVEYYCETEITVGDAPAGVEVVGKQAAPMPYKVGVLQIAWDSVGSEPFEGVLVRIDNVAVIEPNVKGSDGKTHGSFSVGPMGGAGADGPVAHVAGSAGTTFAKFNEETGQTETSFSKGQVFTSISGHLTYNYGAYVLRVDKDASLVGSP